MKTIKQNSYCVQKNSIIIPNVKILEPLSLNHNVLGLAFFWAI